MKVDQYESIFRAADKPSYTYVPVVTERILLVCDLEAQAGEQLARDLERLLAPLAAASPRPEWQTLHFDPAVGLDALLAAVEERGPDLVCTYRNVGSPSYRFPYTLGEAVDVLTQVAPCPVLLIPHPKLEAAGHALENLNVVMALTDHLPGDERLVNTAVAFTERGGTLLLAHIEDDATFERYVNTISRIPSIDTDDARESIRAQLLKGPADFVATCRDELAARDVPVRVEPVIGSGHRTSELRRVVEEHEVDLLIMNTRDEDQLAMHGLAYPLAVGMREIPLLML